MLKRFKSKRRSVVGIDISSASVKALSISDANEPCCIEVYGCECLPDGALEGHVIKDMDAVVSAIKNLFGASPLPPSYIALAIPDSLTISKIAQLNHDLNDKEIEEFVAIEVDKMVDYSQKEVRSDFKILHTSTKNSALLDVLIVASAIDHVNSRVEAMSRAGFEVNIVDVESYAIARAAQYHLATQYSFNNQEGVLVFDLRILCTHSLFLQNGKVLFSYTEPRQLDLCLQIKNRVQSFCSVTDPYRIQRILLAGDAVNFKILAASIQTETGITTSEINPIQSMAVLDRLDRKTIEHGALSLMVACGLALRHVEPIQRIYHD